MGNPAPQLFVFDLDGTLYEDTQHFDFYARSLQRRVPAAVQPSFWNDYEQARMDRHTLRVGRVYDTKNDLVLIHRQLQIQAAFQWNGDELPAARVAQLYPEPIAIDMERFLSVGDLWWVPGSIAAHYGVPAPQIEQAFLETRQYMMSDDFRMPPNPKLRQVLSRLKREGCYTALMTNSPQEDSERILVKLGISDLFDFKRFSSQKPTYTESRLQDMESRFAVDFSLILSVGDNWMNEIAPAGKLGCQTLYIDPHHIGDELPCTYRVHSLSAALEILEKIRPETQSFGK